MGTAACPPLIVGVVARFRPSALTASVTVPAPLVSSSTPTCAVNLLQTPPRYTCTVLTEFVPRPFAKPTPAMEIGRPSPAACSPTLVSRSTGPQPLVAERNGRSLTATVPLGGRGGTARTIRSSELVASAPSCV